MTDELKCPFCGAELRTFMLEEPAVWYCPNHCIGTYEPKVWRELIAGEKARHVLKEIKQTLDECFSSDICGFTVFWDVIARRVHSVITHSTKQGE